MSDIFVVSLIGEATPNDIQQLAAITHENLGKWLVSKVNFIDNQVAGIIKIEIPKEKKAILIDAFKACPKLTVLVNDSDLTGDTSEETLYQLRLDSDDRAGIVNDITHLLDSQRIRVLDLNSQRIFVSGNAGVSSTIFTANITVKVPPHIAIADVTKELEALGDNVKVMIEE